MNWHGGGFIQIINYSSGASEATSQNFTILTENSFDLLTESGSELLIEAAP